MKTKQFRNIMTLILITGFTAGPQVSSAFAAPWWQFWDQSSSASPAPTASPEEIQADSKKLQDDQGSLNIAKDRVNSSKQALDQASAQLRQDYEKLRADKQAGLDTSATEQAIQTHQQALQSAKNTYQTDLNQAKSFQRKVHQETNEVRQDNGQAPIPYNHGGYHPGQQGQSGQPHVNRGWQNNNYRPQAPNVPNGRKWQNPGHDYREHAWQQNNTRVPYTGNHSHHHHGNDVGLSGAAAQ